ncbi:filamentous hemagglutinin family domain-containing protein, partial [Candidatus Magnetomorum sp. HK-1]
MKTILFLIIALALFLSQNLSFAIDVQQNGLQHPHGITSDNNNTTVKFDPSNSIYGISNGIHKGSNLFHSFDSFNLHQGENAWFFHDSNVQNIISRVTGGEHSWINGKITCGTIDGSKFIPGNANFYMINPSGIMFGGHASINFNGSFHVSTSDYMTFGDGNKYVAKLGEDSVLTAAEPSAFGFLDNDIAPISIEGRGEIQIPGFDDDVTQFSFNELFNNIKELKDTIGGIEAYQQRTISLVGGDISMINGTTSSFYVYLNEENGLKSRIPFGTLTAPGGKINLVSVQSSGEVDIDSPDVSIFRDLGQIFISDNSRIDAPGGSINILCKDIVVDDSIINTGAYMYKSSKDEKPFKYDPYENFPICKSGGQLTIHANNMFIQHGAVISNNTYANYENGGGIIDINIDETLTLAGENEGHMNSSIFSMSNPNNFGDSDAISNAGTINIKAKNFFIDSAGIKASTEGLGNAGIITISVEDSFEIAGTLYTGKSCGLASAAQTKDGVSGNAGIINLSAKNISIFDGAGISTITHNVANAGNIIIQAGETLLLSGVNPYGTTSDGYSSGISSRSTDQGEHGENSGMAGNIDITAKKLRIENGAGIETTTFGGGTGGKITINAEKSIQISGVSSECPFLGLRWAQMDYRKDHPETQDYSVSHIFSSSESKQTYAGKAGEITIEAPEIVIENKGRISTAALNAGGGNLSIKASNQLTLKNSDITVSVATGDKNGGNINIAGKEWIVLNKSSIKATAYAGEGGNIYIKGGNLMQSADSIIDASSKFNNDGTIVKYTPENDISKNITQLKQSFLNASKWADTPCRYRNSDSVSQLTHKNKDGIPSPFDDLLASPPLSLDVIENLYGDHPLMLQLRKGEKLFQQGQFNNALLVWEDCFSGIKKDDPFYIPLLSLMTSAWHAIGKYSKAADEISKSIDIIEQQDDFGKAILLMISGETQLIYHNKKLAEKYWQEALTYAKKINQPVLTASIYNNLGNVYVLTNQMVMASHQYETAFKSLNHSQSNLLNVVMLNNTHLKFLRHDTVFQGLALEKTFQNINDLPPTYQKARYLLTLTFLISEMTDKTNGLQFFTDHPLHSIMDQIINIGNQLNHNDILSFALGKSGALYEKQQEYDMALQQIRRAIFHASMDNDLEILYQWQWQLARIFQAMGDNQTALHSYEQAIHTLE